jgi:uncharacterized membrane protein (UPF0127 family)
MKKTHTFILVFLFIIAMAALSFNRDKATQFEFDKGKVVFLKQGMAIDVEIAITDKQRRIGLMHRGQLIKNAGMLFVFEQEYIQRVWMKNTLIPLDVIFISTQNKVVSFFKNLKPCKKKGCDIYMSDGNAKYMLEVNTGMINGNEIEIGQKVRLAFPL